MSKNFKSEHDLDGLDYAIDLLNHLNIHALDGESCVGHATVINLLVTGLINKIDKLEDRMEVVEVKLKGCLND